MMRKGFDKFSLAIDPIPVTTFFVGLSNKYVLNKTMMDIMSQTILPC